MINAVVNLRRHKTVKKKAVKNKKNTAEIIITVLFALGVIIGSIAANSDFIRKNNIFSDIVAVIGELSFGKMLTFVLGINSVFTVLAISGSISVGGMLQNCLLSVIYGVLQGLYSASLCMGQGRGGIIFALINSLSSQTLCCTAIITILSVSSKMSLQFLYCSKNSQTIKSETVKSYIAATGILFLIIVISSIADVVIKTICLKLLF